MKTESPWEKFAADLFQDFIGDGITQQLDTTQQGVRFCRSSWLRKRAFDMNTCITSADPIN